MLLITSAVSHTSLNNLSLSLIFQCSKVGVPVCLYDSDPLQPDPLYLRSGLCYSCQRNLNEDRRGKKRNQGTSISHSDSPNILYALGSGTKKLRIGKSTIFLKDDAIIINGKSQSWRTHSDSYTYAEIGRDLVPLTQEALQETTRLVESTPSLAEASPSRSSSEIDALYDKAFQSMSKALFLLSEWKSSLHQSVGVSLFQEPPSELPEAVATAAAAVAMGQPKAESSSMASLLLAADNTRKDESIEFHHNEMIDGPNDDVPSVYGV